MDAVFFFKRRKICKEVQKKQKSNYCIYNIICPDTKKIIYIGMTKNIRNRYFQHLTPQIYSTNKKDIVFNKYIEEGKIVLITITHHLTTQEEAIRVEKEQILKTPGLLNDYNYIQKPIKHTTMPRSKVEPHTFIAGQLPVITFENKQYYVDGRMKEIRSVDNFMDKIYPKQVTNKDDIKIINFEFYGNY